MTGFGKGRERFSGGMIEVEIKTLNHKTLSITCNPVEDLFLAEQQLQKLVEEKIFRGKVFVRISKERTKEAAVPRKMILNEKTARAYLRKINTLKGKLKLKGNIEIRDIIAYPGVMEISKEEEKAVSWTIIRKAALKALDGLIAYRKTEGEKLAKDFKKRLARIEKDLKNIREHSKESVKDHRAKLIQSTKEIPGTGKIDRTKLGEEIALFARNCDITEEITRLGGHVSAYRSAISGSEKDVGKKLDFIAQEMQREANTIGAKSSDFSISKAVIEIKSEIEKIREQIRNIE
ncbi:MAG: YicC/YloC family endoribonuclease [Candidatus Omnitrophota bacterium]|nr:YicC family protein [Candidatus Omnitrophota bacterium]